MVVLAVLSRGFDVEFHSNRAPALLALASERQRKCRPFPLGPNVAPVSHVLVGSVNAAFRYPGGDLGPVVPVPRWGCWALLLLNSSVRDSDVRAVQRLPVFFFPRIVPEQASLRSEKPKTNPPNTGRR